MSGRGSADATTGAFSCNSGLTLTQRSFGWGVANGKGALKRDQTRGEKSCEVLTSSREVPQEGLPSWRTEDELVPELAGATICAELVSYHRRCRALQLRGIDPACMSVDLGASHLHDRSTPNHV